MKGTLPRRRFSARRHEKDSGASSLPLSVKHSRAGMSCHCPLNTSSDALPARAGLVVAKHGLVWAKKGFGRDLVMAKGGVVVAKCGLVVAKGCLEVAKGGLVVAR